MTIAAPVPQRAVVYTGFSVHPESVALVMSVLAAYGVEVRRMPDGPDQQRRSLTGGPTQLPNGTQVTKNPQPKNRRTVAPEKLTDREQQVLVGRSDGKTNGEIGKDYFLSEDTVKTHARRLFRKLGVRDRAAAVTVGFRMGLLQ